MTDNDKKLVIDKLSGDLLSSADVKEVLDVLNDDAHDTAYQQWKAADAMEETDQDKADELRESASEFQTEQFKQLVEQHSKARDIWHRVATDNEVYEWIEQYWPFDEPFSDSKAEAVRKSKEKKYEFEDE